MGCNCKSGKEQKLNNLDSNDHLQVAFDAYNDVVKVKEASDYDDADKAIVMSAFYSVYPNAKGEVTVEHAASTIKNTYDLYYGRTK
jgi:hypothetical protein